MSVLGITGCGLIVAAFTLSVWWKELPDTYGVTYLTTKIILDENRSPHPQQRAGWNCSTDQKLQSRSSVLEA